MCCDPDVRHHDYIRALQRQRMEVTTIWPPPHGRLSPDTDILICEYFPEMSDLIPWTPGEADGGLLIILPQNGRYDDAKLVACAPQAVLQRPFSEALIASTVKVAWSQHRYEKRLIDRVTKLDHNVRSLRDVERAKMIIMLEKNIGPDDAYRHLRETAMREQISVSLLASSIVQTSEQLRTS